MSAADIFGSDAEGMWAFYHCEIQVRELIVGGIPSAPNVIRKWIESRMELGDTAMEELLAQTISDRNGPMTVAEKIDALMGSDSAPSVNGFKRNENGELCYEGRNMKAAFKEAANSAYPGTEWPGKEAVSKGFRKGLMSALAERLMVSDYLIGLGVKEPLEVEERIKHVMTPQGPKSAINQVEVVYRPRLSFTLKVRDDFLPEKAWARIWSTMEEIGIGADRGRSDGKFDLEVFDRL